MNDPGVIMRVIECVAKLARPTTQFVRLKNLPFFLRAQIRQRVAIDVFHRNASRAFIENKVVNPYNVLVRQFKAALCFALEVAEFGSPGLSAASVSGTRIPGPIEAVELQ